MATFLFKANYSTEGLQGLLSEGAASRTEAIGAMIDSMGGHLVSIYWAYGDTDVYLVVDDIDDQMAAALALTVGSNSALSSVSTIKLLTAAEMDSAIATLPAYRPPGG